MATDDRDDDGDDDVEHEYGDGDVGDDEHDFFFVTRAAWADQPAEQPSQLTSLGLTSLPSNQVSLC